MTSVQHCIGIVLVLTAFHSATAEEPVEPFRDPDAILASALQEQIQAAAAEQQYREQQRDVVTRWKLLGQASDAELRQAVELASQAAEWSRFLSQQQQRFHAVAAVSTDHSDSILLRVPGLPLAFGSDAFSTVRIPTTDRARGIIRRIEALVAERHSLSLAAVHQQSLFDQQERLRRLQGRRAGADQPDQTGRKYFEASAAVLEPARVEELLRTPVQPGVPEELRLSASTELSRAIPLPFSEFVRGWVLDSRRLLTTQAQRAVQRLQSQRVLLDHVSDHTGSNGLEINAMETEMAALRDRIRSLSREIKIAHGIADATVPSPQQLSTTARMALMMKMTKASYDETQQQLTAATQRTEQLKKHIMTVKQLAGDDPTFAGEVSDLHDDMLVAAATMRQLLAESARREAQVRYAMAVYRLESGRDTDTAVLDSQRARVFSLECDRQADLDLIAARLSVVRRRADSLRRLHAEGHAEWEYVQTAHTGAAVVDVERRRAELQMEIALLCEQLLNTAADQQVLAQRSSAQHPMDR